MGEEDEEKISVVDQYTDDRSEDGRYNDEEYASEGSFEIQTVDGRREIRIRSNREQAEVDAYTRVAHEFVQRAAGESDDRPLRLQIPEGDDRDNVEFKRGVPGTGPGGEMSIKGSRDEEALKDVPTPALSVPDPEELSEDVRAQVTDLPGGPEYGILGFGVDEESGALDIDLLQGELVQFDESHPADRESVGRFGAELKDELDRQTDERGGIETDRIDETIAGLLPGRLEASVEMTEVEIEESEEEQEDDPEGRGGVGGV